MFNSLERLLVLLFSLLLREDRSVVGESRFDREARILGWILFLLALGIGGAAYFFFFRF